MIKLQKFGSGTPLIVIPGMEGDGSSCLDLIQWIISQHPHFAVTMVDYSQENYKTFDELVAAISVEIKSDAPVILWTQSFGNVIGATLLADGLIKVSKHAMLSPFASIPHALVNLANTILTKVPSVIYKKLSKQVSLYLFGPAKGYEDHAFFSSIAAGNPAIFLKRILWLEKIDMKKLFINEAVPAKAWIGDHDRVINPKKQIAFFKNVEVLPGLGHMLFPGLLTEAQKKTFLDFVTN